jgi:hypothetical protein
MYLGVIVPNHLYITFEESVIYNIKADDSCEKSYVCFGYIVSKEIGIMIRLAQVGLHPEGAKTEEGAYNILVSVLA